MQSNSIKFMALIFIALVLCLTTLSAQGEFESNNMGGVANDERFADTTKFGSTGNRGGDGGVRHSGGDGSERNFGGDGGVRHFGGDEGARNFGSFEGNTCRCMGRHRMTRECCDESRGFLQFEQCHSRRSGRFMRCCESRGLQGSCSTF